MFLLAWVPLTYAQIENFDKCYGSPKSTVDVELKVPCGFNAIDSAPSTFFINPESSPYLSSWHGNVFQSVDSNCVLLFPKLYSSILSYKGQVRSELEAVGNDRENISDIITTVVNEDMSTYCNADTAYIYRLKLPQPFMDKYSHCVGIYLRKYAHPAILMKVMMTDEGLIKADNYVKLLLSCVKYGNTTTAESIKVEEWLEDSRRHNPNL